MYGIEQVKNGAFLFKKISKMLKTSNCATSGGRSFVMSLALARGLVDVGLDDTTGVSGAKVHDSNRFSRACIS